MIANCIHMKLMGRHTGDYIYLYISPDINNITVLVDRRYVTVFI